MVRLQVGRLVGDVAVAPGVRLVEGVARERLDQLPHRPRPVLRVAVRHRPVDEARALRRHHLRLLLPHRLPHHVRLAQRVAGEALGDLQHLVLVDDDAVRVREDLREVGVRVLDRLVAVAGADVRRDVRHRPRPVERHHRADLSHALRLQLLHVPTHPRRLQLEHPERLALPERLHRRRVRFRQLQQVQLHPRCVLHELHRATEDGQVREPQEVDLEQAHRLDLLHRELGRRDREFVPPSRPLQWHVFRQRLPRDHNARGVRARMASHAFELLRRVHQAAHLRVRFVRLLQLGRLRERVLERDVQRVRDVARDPVRVRVGHAQRPPHVPDGRLRPQRPERDDLRHLVDPRIPIGMRSWWAKSEISFTTKK